MRITLIGSGNVATHLAAAFKNAGHRIVQVYSRKQEHAALLAYHVKAEAIDDLKNVNPDTDVFVIAVKDDVIEEIAAVLVQYKQLLVHTSGATYLSALAKHTANSGVFYPLQTFSKTKEVDFNTVPICVEGYSDEITVRLEALAHTVSQSVYRVNSAQREVLHLAAVFACNFPNYLYHIAQRLLADQQLPFNLLKPLILETAQKVQKQEPSAVQTGPAIRHDQSTMTAHLKQLVNHADLQHIYELLSQGIIKMANEQPDHQ